MKHYSLGFMFYKNHVVLIKKARPEWQKGLLNGVGGHIEEGESALDCMIREFKEETGIFTTKWTQIAHVFREGDFRMAVYKSSLKEKVPLVSEPSEPTDWYDLDKLNRNEMISNLPMLLTIALEPLTYPVTIEYASTDHKNVTFSF